MNSINLYGAGGHCKVILDILTSCNLTPEIIYDDNPKEGSCHNVPIAHSRDIDSDSPIIISIGDNRCRKMVATKLENLKFATAIHPSAIVSPFATIDAGSVVMQGAIIQSDASIGRHCIVNTGASIDHDCKIDDFVHISPHATLCGNVHVGEGAWIGAGAIVIPGVRIGKWSIVGAGAVVIHDIPDNAVAVGNPAKVNPFEH